jgi:hypothetical protein
LKAVAKSGACGFETNQKETIIMSLHTPDLTKFPPRSPRVRLGGYVILPRMLDKGRATLAGKNGEYHYACPLDQRFLEFAGIDPEELKKNCPKATAKCWNGFSQRETQALAGRKSPRGRHWQEQRAPADVESREYFNGLHKPPRPSARTSRRGSTCWTWTTT